MSKGLSQENGLEHATIGGGCFWCLEAIFQRVKGVRSVVSGYAGGETTDPNYRSVCSGSTGHAEVVRIAFDTGTISFEDLLDVFWAAHDPTTLNRQGGDVGTQYRSIILYENDEQKAVAEKSVARVASKFSDPVVTEIVPLDRFYPAEDYHQNYFRDNGGQPYCRAVIEPKVRKLFGSA